MCVCVYLCVCPRVRSFVSSAYHMTSPFYSSVYSLTIHVNKHLLDPDYIPSHPILPTSTALQTLINRAVTGPSLELPTAAASSYLLHPPRATSCTRLELPPAAASSYLLQPPRATSCSRLELPPAHASSYLLHPPRATSCSRLELPITPPRATYYPA